MGISNRHTVVPFVAGKSEPMADQRLAKVGYKVTKDKKTGKEIPAKFPAVCASVPMIEDSAITENLTALIPHIRAMLEDTQDKVFRSLYESSDGKLGEIGDSDISVESCIAYLETEREGGRLTKEFMAAWFDKELADSLTVVFLDKLGFSEGNEDQMATVAKHVAGHKELFVILGNGKQSLSVSQCQGLRNVLKLAPEDDPVAEKLETRIVKMLEPAQKLADLLMID